MNWYQHTALSISPVMLGPVQRRAPKDPGIFKLANKLSIIVYQQNDVKTLSLPILSLGRSSSSVSAATVVHLNAAISCCLHLVRFRNHVTSSKLINDQVFFPVRMDVLFKQFV